MQRYCPAFTRRIRVRLYSYFPFLALLIPLSPSSYLQLFIKKHTLSKRKDVEKRTNKTFSLLMSLPSSTTPSQIEKATKENPVDIS